MPEIRDVGLIAEKWRSRAPQAAGDYKDGVERTTKDWAKNTTSANAAWEAGVTAAISAGRWVKGVEKTGTAMWRERTLAKGPARWVSGIQLSGDAYELAFQRYAAVIKRTNLPKRGPRGSAENYRRSQLMGEALHAERMKG